MALFWTRTRTVRKRMMRLLVRVGSYGLGWMVVSRMMLAMEGRGARVRMGRKMCR